MVVVDPNGQFYSKEVLWAAVTWSLGEGKFW